MPSTGLTLTNTFGPLPGPVLLSQLDTNYSQLATMLNALQTQGNYYVDSSGAANSITVTVPAPLTFSYAAGVPLQVKVANTNTGAGAVTINVNGGGAQALKNQDGSAIAAGQLKAGGVYGLQYDGTNFQVISGGVAFPTYPQTPAEQSAGVTPANFYITPGYAIRQETNTTPATTDMQPGIQAAINAASTLDAEVYLKGSNAIAKPLILKTTTQQNISIIGNGRVSTTLFPLAANIATAPESINALVINKNNNTHLHLSKFGCSDAVVYTGVFLYCTEGGGGDGLAQALFSAVISDCWFAFSSNNAGYFRGGFSNLLATGNVFESTKNACFRLEGVGNGDQQYIGNVMNFCYDSFIYGVDDTQTKALITINTLHSYQHLRGPLVEAKNVVNSIFNDIIEEPDAANVGTTGILKLTDSAGIIGSNLTMKSRSGVPRGSCCLEFINGAMGTYTNIVSDATTGIKFSGTGALDLTFENCDFTGCDNAVQFLSGTLSGKLVFRGCKFNNAQLYCVLVSAGTMSWDLTMYDCELMNAGLNATATNRNMDMNTSGKVRLIRCKIGQDNVSAAAACFIKNSGSGTFEVIDPIQVGLAPTAFNDGTSAIIFDGVDSIKCPAIGAQYPLVPAVGGSATYTTQQGHWSIKSGTLHFQGRLTVNAIGTGSTTVMSGFPFTSNATYYGGGMAHFFAASAIAVTMIAMTIGPASTSATMRSLTAAGTGTANNAIFQNSTDIIFTGSYPLP
jgi:hypothetical protein